MKLNSQNWYKVTTMKKVIKSIITGIALSSCAVSPAFSEGITTGGLPDTADTQAIIDRINFVDQEAYNANQLQVRLDGRDNELSAREYKDRQELKAAVQYDHTVTVTDEDMTDSITGAVMKDRNGDPIKKISSSVDTSKVILKGSDGTTISNVKAGTVSLDSTEAVNGSQLKAATDKIQSNTDSISGVIETQKAQDKALTKESQDRIQGYQENSSRITQLAENKADKDNVEEVRKALITESSERIKNDATKVSKDEFSSSQSQQDDKLSSLDSSQKSQEKSLATISTTVEGNSKTSQEALQKVTEGTLVNARQDESISQLNQDLEYLSTSTQKQVSDVKSEMSSKFSEVNSKLDQQQKEYRGGIAVAAAMSNIPQAIHAGHGSVGVGTANFKGSNGVALGASYRFDDDRTTIKGSVGKSSSYTVVGAGVSYEF